MNSPLRKTIMKDLPIKMKNNVDMNSLYNCHTFKVAVNYCVLRPQAEEYT